MCNLCDRSSGEGGEHAVCGRPRNDNDLNSLVGSLRPRFLCETPALRQEFFKERSVDPPFAAAGEAGGGPRTIGDHFNFGMYLMHAYAKVRVPAPRAPLRCGQCRLHCSVGRTAGGKRLSLPRSLSCGGIIVAASNQFPETACHCPQQRLCPLIATFPLQH